MKYVLIVLLLAFSITLTKGSGNCESCNLDTTGGEDVSRWSLRSYLQCLRNCGESFDTELEKLEKQLNEKCGTAALSASLLTVLGALLVTVYRNIGV